MSEELFEVAFSGKIIEGGELEQVKLKVGAIFKADAAKLTQLFSGKRVVIKKNIDQATANKYKTALNNAGAVCEVKSLSDAIVEEVAKPTAPVPASTAPAPVKPAPPVVSGDVPAAPKTDPLGIRADDISELSANIAPLGSDMQDEIKAVPEPELDVSGLDIAPPGSDLGEIKKAEPPPPPDTSGITMADS